VIGLDRDPEMNNKHYEKVRMALAIGCALCGCFVLSLPTGDFISSKLILTGLSFTFSYMLFFRKGLGNPRLIRNYKQKLAKKSL
jgi:hypothetical protein